jgi:hypothetical protein
MSIALPSFVRSQIHFTIQNIYVGVIYLASAPGRNLVSRTLVAMQHHERVTLQEKRFRGDESCGVLFLEAIAFQRGYGDGKIFRTLSKPEGRPFTSLNYPAHSHIDFQTRKEKK